MNIPVQAASCHTRVNAAHPPRWKPASRVYLLLGVCLSICLMGCPKKAEKEKLAFIMRIEDFFAAIIENISVDCAQGDCVFLRQEFPDLTKGWIINLRDYNITEMAVPKGKWFLTLHLRLTPINSLCRADGLKYEFYLDFLGTEGNWDPFLAAYQVQQANDKDPKPEWKVIERETETWQYVTELLQQVQAESAEEARFVK
jgi:hypothetical protein